jgi:curved DNA-binding protein CbpA
MARLKPTADPYRILSVLRGATPTQVKAAHRRLAKRYHPDGSTGDEARFMAVQEAYQLLTDPRRRREWDRAHAPGPVRATAKRGQRVGTAPTTDRPRPRSARVKRPRASTPRTGTWSAEHVPWWNDFQPGSKDRSAAAAPSPGSATTDDTPNEFDVFNRSSGAAWSAAARRHFRRGTDDLPSRGVWRYRGTQVVTGAEARKVAAEEQEKRRR